MTEDKKSEYVVYKLPKDLDEEIQKIADGHGYRSKTEFVKDAVHRLCLSRTLHLKSERKFTFLEEAVYRGQYAYESYNPPRISTAVQKFICPCVIYYGVHVTRLPSYMSDDHSLRLLGYPLLQKLRVHVEGLWICIGEDGYAVLKEESVRRARVP